MPEFIQKFEFNSVYICLLLFIYNLWKSSLVYINIILYKLYLLNYTSVLIAINIIGLYLFLRTLTFEINIQCSIKYK